jgi:hypothetical protein
MYIDNNISVFLISSRTYEIVHIPVATASSALLCTTCFSFIKTYVFGLAFWQHGHKLDFRLAKPTKSRQITVGTVSCGVTHGAWETMVRGD